MEKLPRSAGTRFALKQGMGLLNTISINRSLTVLSLTTASALSLGLAPASETSPAPVGDAKPAPASAAAPTSYPSSVQLIGAGGYQVQYLRMGSSEIRNVFLPAELGVQIQPEFHPDRSEVTYVGGHLATITLIENATGEPSHHMRKIMIDLSSASPSCRAVIYPSGGTFYSLPVLVNRSCQSVVRDPALAAN